MRFLSEHRNHFSQSYTLQVQWILEAVFARLGVKHQARNFGNGGLGTIHNALGAGSVYGPDVDMLMWDSSMTEGDLKDIDVFGRQAILGGLKVPVLWNLKPDILKIYHIKAEIDVGHTGSGKVGIPKQESVADIEKAPWAAKYLFCGGEIQSSICRPNEYNGTCWIERPDYTPATKQNPEPGGRAGWHPGNRYHQLTGRVLAFTILSALYEVLVEWSEVDGYVVPDDAWHVTSYYEKLRANIRALSSQESGCGQKFNQDTNLALVCDQPIKVSLPMTNLGVTLLGCCTLIIYILNANFPFRPELSLHLELIRR